MYGPQLVTLSLWRGTRPLPSGETVVFSTMQTSQNLADYKSLITEQRAERAHPAPAHQHQHQQAHLVKSKVQGPGLQAPFNKIIQHGKFILLLRFDFQYNNDKRNTKKLIFSYLYSSPIQRNWIKYSTLR